MLATNPGESTLRRFGWDFGLDHIFYRRLQPVDSGCVETEVSDHQPVWASFVRQG